MHPVSCFRQSLLLTGMLLAAGLARAEYTVFSREVDLSANLGLQYDDNVTRANRAVDKLGDHAYSAELGARMHLPFASHVRGVLGAGLNGESHDLYGGLNHATGSLQGELQYRNSAEFGSPLYALFLRGYVDQYESSLRTGSRYTAGISMRQSLTDRIGYFVAIAHDRRVTNSEVFCISEDSLRLNVDYATGRRGTLYLGGELRKGDVVSTGQSSLENIDMAEVFTQDGAFPGAQLYAYRFKGESTLYTLGYNLGFGAHHALDFSWRTIESRSSVRPAYAINPSIYQVNQYSVVYLYAF